jgi:hypothetical protein
LESAKAIVRGSKVYFAGGRRDSNAPNSDLLIYDLRSRSWTAVQLDSGSVDEWALHGGGVVTVTRSSSGRALEVKWLDFDGKKGQAATIKTDLEVVDYLSVLPRENDLLIAASDRDQTQVFVMNPRGDVEETRRWGSNEFLPARFDAPRGISVGSTGGQWLSAGDRGATAIDLESLKPVRPWAFDVCATDSAWIFGGTPVRALRYGGQACCGDAAKSIGSELERFELGEALGSSTG